MVATTDPVAVFRLQARVPARKHGLPIAASYGHAIDAGVPNHVEACLALNNRRCENDVVPAMCFSSRKNPIARPIVSLCHGSAMNRDAATPNETHLRKSRKTSGLLSESSIPRRI